jgi:aminoglycoside 3-N-acetyltransferase
MNVGLEKLIADFRNLGLKAGEKVILHSSLKSVGRVEGGPNTVIDAILACVESRGHLMAPTFTYSVLGAANALPFNPRSTPSRVGLVTDTLWRRPDAHRSLHPTHSVAIIGPDAERAIRGHERLAAFEEGTPFEAFGREGCKVVMLGTSLKTCSLIHVAEILADCPYVGFPLNTGNVRRDRAVTVDERGRQSIVPMRKTPGCAHAFVKLREPLEKAGVWLVGRVGSAETIICDGAEMLRLATAALREEPLLFVDKSADCQVCRIRIRLLKERGFHV